MGVGDGARADDGAIGQFTGLGGGDDQVGEIEAHVLARVGLAVEAAVDVDADLEVQAVVAPFFAQLVGGYEDGREAGGGLRVEKAEAVLEIARHEAAQGNIVADADEADGGAGLVPCGPHGDVGGDDDHLGLEIDGKVGFGHDDGGHGGEEAVGAALIHDRVFVLELGILAALEGAHAIEMDHIAGAVDPLIGARQRGQRLSRVEEHAGNLSIIKLIGHGLEDRRGAVPIVQRDLEIGGDAAGRGETGEVFRDDDQMSVGTAVAQGGEFHG